MPSSMPSCETFSFQRRELVRFCLAGSAEILFVDLPLIERLRCVRDGGLDVGIRVGTTRDPPAPAEPEPCSPQCPGPCAAMTGSQVLKAGRAGLGSRNRSVPSRVRVI